MALTTVLFWISLVLSVIGSNAAGELVVLHSPDSLQFTGSNEALESSLKEIFSASLGLSVEENSAWDGLKIKSPFQTPEAVVEIYTDGVASLGDAIDLNGAKHYPLKADEYEPDTFEAMKHRIKQRFAESNNKLVNIKLANLDELSTNNDGFGDIPVPKVQKRTYQYLKLTVDEDKQFLMELAALDAIIDKVKSGVITADNSIDFFNFRVISLHAISDYYGPDSMQTKEAKKLLGAKLKELSDAFVTAYDGSVLVTVVTTDVTHTRRMARSVSDFQARAVKDKYPEDYAAIFNILLWFGVVFVFTLIAIVYALIDMDPGRDSIIYRMTSTRMKKDN